MLITLCYVYLWLRLRSSYALLIRSCVRQLHRSSSFTFCTQQQGRKIQSGLKGPWEDKCCLKVGDKAFLIDRSQLFEDLNKWSLLLGPPSDKDLGVGRIAFITESISLPSGLLSAAASQPSKEVLKLSEYCLPLALCHGDSSRLLAEASVDNFSELGIAFMEDRLQMDNGSLPQKITSVHLREPSVNKEEVEDGALYSALRTATQELKLTSSEKGGTEEMGIAESTENSTAENSNDGTDPRNREEARGEHLHLHLSSCHECLELESCTIESVKFASAENIPELPDDSNSFEDNSDVGYLKESSSLNRSGKPPNVLIYGGSTSQDHFQIVKSVLQQCFDSCRYVIYPLPEDQALKAPWMDNCLLLVVAGEEPIPLNIHKLFTSYLGKGGKILGLSSSLTFGSMVLKRKSELLGSVQAFIFDSPNGSQIQLNVLTSGYVYEERCKESCEEEDQWGYLDNDSRDMMLVHQTYGENAGEAVLCQVRLELPPESLTDHDKGTFDSLKLSNTQRHEVLTQILSSLGLDCEASTSPSLTPVYLLTAQTDNHPDVLRWLKSRTDQKGVIKSSKMTLQVCESPQHDVEITPSLAPLIVGEECFVSDDFNLEKYRENLQTEKLGRVVLYAEVTTTTFNLLDGLMFHEPKEMGLIAIASRQTQGKGRGGNVWLSPKGCALMTLLISIPLSSQLGQRIAFIQHLMSLAVVEAVRSMSGYEDIELKVKWPNDIYYSNLMKLGGVLVNSTLMGNTFHILIGCGFNVSNSNPTICINDLISQHNKRYKTNIDLLRADMLIARSVSRLEQLINIFQTKGPNGVLPTYYRYWVHSGQQVRLGGEDGPWAWIVGVDDSGFLQVLQEGKEVVTVHPDGNSFDMIRNLIIPKH